MDIILNVSYWWFIFFLLSFVFYPLVRPYLSNLVDRGWISSKVIGLLILTYSSYLIGIFHLFKFSQLELWLILTFWFLASRVTLIWQGREATLVKDWQWLKKAASMEILFLALLLFMSFIRSFKPQIADLEKYMDFGFINAALNGDYFPPKDMWWSGGFINYYYFGHLWVANLIKLTGITPGVAFNLSLATCFAFCGSLIIEYTWSWTKNIWFGFLGAFLHLGIGNLHLLTTVWQKGWDNYWYPDGSRLIYHVITEFPVYSFVVYDLHAHVLAFPQDLLIIGLVGEFFRQKKFFLKEGILIGFLLGLNFLTNAWDLAIYFLLFILTLILLVSLQVRKIQDLIPIAKGVIAAVITSVLVILPFWLYFKKLTLPVLLTTTHSPIYQLFQLWGFWFFLLISFNVFSWKKTKGFFTDRFSGEEQSFDLFILLLMATGFLLVIIPEFIYVKDIYSSGYERANTVFKLTFQSWNIWAMGAGFIVWRIWSAKVGGIKRLLKGIWLVVFALLVLSCTAYTLRAYKSGYGDFKNFSSLDGEAFLSSTYSSAEVKGINWLKSNTPKEAVVLEAAGDSYTNYGRISVFSGRSTVVGWAVHEWLWRGTLDPVTKRQTDVNTLYITNDEREFRDLIAKYKINYVYLGGLERQKYSGASGKGLVDNGQVVFKEGEVEIYKLNDF